MSVLVKGMEKPEHCGYCRFRYDGICHALQKTQYSMDECPLAGIDDVPDINVGDMISRQAAIKAIEELQDCYNGFSDTYDKACIIGVLEEVPSAQPETPSYVAEIESEYKKWVRIQHINKPLAKALYEVWKKHDREDVSRNG